MPERNALETELRALRDVADKRRWNDCREATEKLLRRLPAARALELARQQVERRLPTFERHQPGVTWPRDFLESLRVSDPLGEDGYAWPWENDEFAGPGANNFIAGLDALWRARRLPGDDSQRWELLVDAISGAVMAEIMEAWGARHPQEWANWLWRGPELEAHPDRSRIQTAMMTAPETVRIERAAWLDVADRLAEALGVPFPSSR